MKKLRDGFLYEHLPKVSKLMNDELEKRISVESYPEGLDQKIRLLAEQKEKKRFCIPKAAVILICVMSTATVTVAVDAATGGKLYTVIKEFFGAEEVTDENRDMIGAENLNEISSETHSEINWENEISYKSGVLPPASITGFVVENSTTPEIILSNGACVLFHQKEGVGWYCKTGDILLFEFSKHEALSGISQRIRIGYILDGVMYEGEAFDEINGCYQLDVDKEGMYYLYVTNVSSDSITLKEGKIY